MLFDAAVLLPTQDRMRRQLGAIVRDNHVRPAAQFDDAVEFAHDTLSGERHISHCSATIRMTAARQSR